MSKNEWRLVPDDGTMQGQIADYYLEGPEEKPLPVARVWGAISWPGSTSGYACVAVQPNHSAQGQPIRSDMRPDKREVVWPVYLAAEVEGNTMKEFVRRLLAVEKAWHVESWYREDDDASKRFAGKAYDLVREMEGRWNRSLSTVASPLAGQPSLAVNSLLSALEDQRVFLVEPEVPFLTSQVRVASSLPHSELRRRLEDDLHAVRALTHALGAFDQQARVVRPRGGGRRRSPAEAY